VKPSHPRKQIPAPPTETAVVARAPDGLTLDECFDWMRRYRAAMIVDLPETRANDDFSAANVLASLAWHSEQLRRALLDLHNRVCGCDQPGAISYCSFEEFAALGGSYGTS
jgi:hypothetical protein